MAVKSRAVAFTGTEKAEEGVDVFIDTTGSSKAAAGARLMAQRKCNFRSLITHRLEPETCQETYTMLRYRPDEALGVVFKRKR